ncbi:MAG TPA: biotin--[acetyl-CoA-carboxylase] ligase [Solirubrobacteraceae bacterium]|nr:biotin--[acetyl-CoA-carboxylase] ligase [Solirubrobacteraceae bacterium]
MSGAAALGRPRVHLRRTDSTNRRARELAIAGAPHGTLVTAGEQTDGRGRQGRRWSAPPESALLMSLVLRWAEADWSLPTTSSSPPAPTSPPSRSSLAAQPTLLPLLAAVAVCDVAGEQASVKWPNDVVIERAGERALAKLAGILVEGRPQQGWAVLGIGLNVAVRVQELPVELHASAASMGEQPSAVEPVLERLLGALEQRLGEPAETTLQAWRERDALLGKEITWSAGSGRAEGIDGMGRLVVRLADGGRTTLDAGEVHLGSGSTG